MVTRIRQLLEWQQLSPTQFADLIGVGRPVVSHILSERNKPSLEVVQRISEALPAVSLTWLLKGTGNMLNATPASASPGAAELAAPVAAPAPPPAPVVNEVPVVAAQPPVATPPPPAYRRQQSGEPRQKPARFVKARAVTAQVDPALELSGLAAAPVTPLASTTPSTTALPASKAQVVLAVPPVEYSGELPANAETVPAVAGIASAAVAAAMLSEPGKAIRRIVIFYRDGSFADYQPEV